MMHAKINLPKPNDHDSTGVGWSSRDFTDQGLWVATGEEADGKVYDAEGSYTPAEAREIGSWWLAAAAVAEEERRKIQSDNKP